MNQTKIKMSIQYNMLDDKEIIKLIDSPEFELYDDDTKEVIWEAVSYIFINETGAA